jgi:hypothetical protein
MSCGIVVCASAAFVGCAAEGSDGSQHGPSFDGDAATDASMTTHDATAATDAAHDAFVVDATQPIDATLPDDATPPDDATSPNDATAPDDASDAAMIVDAGVDAPMELDASGCTSTAAVVAGGTGSIAASVFESGQWGAASTLGGSASARPAVAAIAGGFQAVIEESGSGALVSTTYATTSWSPLSAVGAATAMDAPALAPIATDLHLVYQGKDFKFYHGIYTGGSWQTTNDPVGGSATQAFGPSGPAAAAQGTNLVTAQSGQDNVVYTDVWSTTWQSAQALTGSSVESAFRPTLVALAGGTSDLLVVYLRKTDRHLMYAAHTGGTWQTPSEIYDVATNVAFSNDPVSIAPLTGGGAIVAFRGTDQKPYYATWDGGGNGWTAPAAMTSGATLASPPALAAGVCGADAFAAYVDTNGATSVLTLSGGAWSAPQSIAGATGATYVGIATSP